MASKYSDSDDLLQHKQRVSDFDTKSCEYLLPIKGYEKQPLVSLEEAIEPLVLCVPDVKQMAHVAKRACKKPPADGLTVDESASIMLYSMDWQPREECLYHVLNTTLRAKNRAKLVPWFLYLKLILTALDRLPSKHPVVYRGIKLDLRKDYTKESPVIWWGFTSCTSSIDVLSNEQFLGSSGTRTFFTIQCTSGKDIRQHSYFADEEEILLPPGREFQVVGCLNQSGGLHMIQLKEVQPVYPHLEPLPKVR
jgi:NAD:arginine ADP-ribosyltransferase